MAKNSVIKLITDNYDMAKEWYHALMENDEMPGICKISGLPKNHEDKVNTVALFIISNLELLRTSNREVNLPTEETMVAMSVFESLMDANLQQKI